MDNPANTSPNSTTNQPPVAGQPSNESGQESSDSQNVTEGTGSSTSSVSPDPRKSSLTKSAASDSQVPKPRKQTGLHEFLTHMASLSDVQARKDHSRSLLRAMEYSEREKSEFTNVFEASSMDKLGPKRSTSKIIGLSPVTAAMFMVAVATGFAASRLPFDVMQSTWFGIFLIILFAVNFCFTGLCQCWSWVIMEERWPEYHYHTTTPYLDLAEKSLGLWMRYVAEFIVLFTHLSIGCVYIIEIARMFSDISSGSVGYCPIVIGVSIIILPFMWFRTYRNFKFIGVVDVVFSVLWALMVVVCVFMDEDTAKQRTYDKYTAESIAFAFSDISFAYGPGASFASIMSDMQDRSLFQEASVSAFFIVILIYLFPAILVYASYGMDTPEMFVHELIPPSLTGIEVTIMEVFFLIQILTSLVIFVMPAMHAIENRLQFIEKFNTRRMALRCTIVVLMMLIGLGWPDITRLVPIIGATGINLLSFLFPPIFYVCLVYKKDRKRRRKRFLTKKEWILVVEMILLAVTVILLGTYFTVRAAIQTPGGSEPCFKNFAAANHEKPNKSTIF